MAPAADQAHQIYAAMVQEASQRLAAASTYLLDFGSSQSLPTLESAILQVRKALEAIALASIAPNRNAYEEFRSRAEEQKDYTKDYHAGKIFRVLGKINPDFYPVPLTGPTKMPDGMLFFGRKHDGYLTKKRFESFYDQLGKHLHAHNPWGTNKNLQNLAIDLPAVIIEASSLLDLHATFIRTQEFTGAWVVQVPRDGSSPRVVAGATQGEFKVGDG